MRELLRIIPCNDALADIAPYLPAVIREGYELRLQRVVDAQRSSFDFVLLDNQDRCAGLWRLVVLAGQSLWAAHCGLGLCGRRLAIRVGFGVD